MLGNKGIANLLIYITPGITLELGMLFFPNYVSSVFSGFMAGMIANATGAFIMGLLFMRLPLIPLTVSIGLASVYGGAGGIIGFKLSEFLNRLSLAKG